MATLPLGYFGSVDYYAVMAMYGTVIIDDAARYDKRQKETHRCTIADTHGLLRLTVPVAKPGATGRVEGRLTWHDIAVSDHGDWWQDFGVSLASAYGRTPFYEFYIDRLRHLFSRETARSGCSVAWLDLAADRAVRGILQLPTRVIPASEIAEEDYCIENQEVLEVLPTFPETSYYQVRAAEQGFHHGLSILDLIFNLGPEAPLHLYAMAKSGIKAE